MGNGYEKSGGNELINGVRTPKKKLFPVVPCLGNKINFGEQESGARLSQLDLLIILSPDERYLFLLRYVKMFVMFTSNT